MSIEAHAVIRQAFYAGLQVLAAPDGQLQVMPRTPGARLTDDLREQLREHKTEIRRIVQHRTHRRATVRLDGQQYDFHVETVPLGHPMRVTWTHAGQQHSATIRHTPGAVTALAKLIHGNHETGTPPAQQESQATSETQEKAGIRRAIKKTATATREEP